LSPDIAARFPFDLSIHVWEHSPPDPARVFLIVAAEGLGERPLFQGNRRNEIRHGECRKGKAIPGHMRRAEYRKSPSKVERMPDDPIRARGLQSSCRCTPSDTG